MSSSSLLRLRSLRWALPCFLLVISLSGVMPSGCRRAKRGPLLAVSQTDGNRVTLIAVEPEEHEIRSIPVSCKGPFGVAFDHNREWLYTACWDHSQIALINLRSKANPVIFHGASLPAWIRARDRSNEMWISNEGSRKVTIYRSGTSNVLGEIITGEGPSDIVFTNNGRKAWVSNETSGNISLLDAERKRKIRDTPVGKVPQGMAVTNGERLLLVANFGSNTISVIDTGNAREITQIPVCEGPVDVAAYVRNGRPMAYVSCFKGGSVAVVDLARKKEIERVAVGNRPFSIDWVPGGDRLYVCVGGSNELVIIQPGSKNRIIRRMKLEGNPLRMAVSP